MAGDDWEASATGLPLAKKCLEGTLFASISRKDHLRLVGLKAACADVFQGLFFVVLVLVRLLLLTVPLIKTNTNAVLFHECLGDALDVTTAGRAFGSSATFATTTILLLRTGRGYTLLKSVLLRSNGHVRLDVIKMLFDELPIIRELKVLHLPCLMNLTVSLKNI